MTLRNYRSHLFPSSTSNFLILVAYTVKKLWCHFEPLFSHTQHTTHCKMWWSDLKQWGGFGFTFTWEVSIDNKSRISGLQCVVYKHLWSYHAIPILCVVHISCHLVTTVDRHCLTKFTECQTINYWFHMIFINRSAAASFIQIFRKAGRGNMQSNWLTHYKAGFQTARVKLFTPSLVNFLFPQKTVSQFPLALWQHSSIKSCLSTW